MFFLFVAKRLVRVLLEQLFPKQSSSWQLFRLVVFLESGFSEATVFFVAAFPTCSLEAATDSGGMGSAR